MKRHIMLLILALVICSGFLSKPDTAYATAVAEEKIDVYAEMEAIPAIDIPVSTGITMDETYLTNGGQFLIPADVNYYAIPFTVQSGYFNCIFALDELLAEGYFDVTLLDESFNTIKSEMLYDAGLEFSMELETGKYYFYLERSSSCVGDIRGTIAATTFTTTDFAITVDQTAIGYIKDSSEIRYIKITVPKDGLLDVKLIETDEYNIGCIAEVVKSYGPYGSSVVLCSSKKKAITTSEYTTTGNDYKASFAVKKGTYYIKVTGIYDSNFVISTSMSKQTTMGKNTKKAAALTLGSKTKTVVLGAGSNTVYWYKFTLSKAKKITVAMEHLGGTGWVDITIYKGTEEVYTGHLYDEETLDVAYQTYDGKETTWDKGTYYIKINKYNINENSVMSLKLK